MELLIIQFSPTSYYFISLRFTYTARHSLSGTPYAYVLLILETKFATHTKLLTGSNCNC
jgi:hypothetical protein